MSNKVRVVIDETPANKVTINNTQVRVVIDETPANKVTINVS